MNAHAGLHRWADAVTVGQESTLRSKFRTGDVRRVYSGGYIEPDVWAKASSEERIRFRAAAVDGRANRIRPVFSHTTALAFWRLPVHEAHLEPVHVTRASGYAHRPSPGVVRHTGALPDDAVDTIDGLLVTSLERTLVDVALAASLEAAVVAWDAAMRRAAETDDGGERLTERLEEYLDAYGGGRGVRQARFVLGFCDSRAQLPGESVSRLWIQRSGLAAPVLQHPVRRPGGRWAFVDMAWPAQRIYGEFDGDGKYVDPIMTKGRSVREVLRAQRQREADIIHATGWRPVHWGWERLTSANDFGTFLRGQGLS